MPRRSCNSCPTSGGRNGMAPVGGGIFEVRLPNRTSAISLPTRDSPPIGVSPIQRSRDPYSFPQRSARWTFISLDEGRHERLWEKLGARPNDFGRRPGDGVRRVGTQRGLCLGRGRFQLLGWPHPSHANARCLGHLGALHPRTRRGDAATNSNSVPVTGTANSSRRTRWLFGPRSRQQTASIVHRLDHYRWQDAAWMSERKVRRRTSNTRRSPSMKFTRPPGDATSKRATQASDLPRARADAR